MFIKRKLLTVSAVLSFTAIMGIPHALAQGGNDPIPGIDIIILKDPSSQPIKPFSFGGLELKKLNALHGEDRPNFVLETIAARINAGQRFVKSGMDALGDIWCDTCEMADSFEVKFHDAGATYTLRMTFRGSEAKRPTKQLDKAKVQQRLDLPNPKAQTILKK